MNALYISCCDGCRGPAGPRRCWRSRAVCCSSLLAPLTEYSQGQADGGGWEEWGRLKLRGACLSCTTQQQREHTIMGLSFGIRSTQNTEHKEQICHANARTIKSQAYQMYVSVYGPICHVVVDLPLLPCDDCGLCDKDSMLGRGEQRSL